MHRLWLVTILTTTTLLHISSTNAAPILTSPLNITDESANENSTLPSEDPKVQNNPRLLAKALDLDDWWKDNEDEPTSIGKRAIATSAIIKNTTSTKVATIASTTVANTTVSTTTISTTTVPTTTTPPTTAPTTTTPTTTTPTTTASTTTIPTTTTTLDIQVVVDTMSTDLVPNGSPDDEVVFNIQESPDHDTQIATGGSDDSDAPKIHFEVTPAPEPVEIINAEGFRNLDDEDYVAESSATASPSSDSESHEDADLDDDDSSKLVYESSASTPSANRSILKGSEIEKILPNTIDTDYFVDKPYNGDVYPLTLSDQVNIFMHEFGENHPGVAYVLVCTLLAIIVMLIFVAVRECCKSRIRKRSRTPPSVTADLYNTSACSHFYQKPTLLPNQQDVTMQLVSSDIAEDMV